MNKNQIFDYLRLKCPIDMTELIESSMPGMLDILYAARFISDHEQKPVLTYLGYSATLISPDNCVALLQQALLQRSMQKR